MPTEEEIKAIGDQIRGIAERAEAAMRAGRSVRFDSENEIVEMGDGGAFKRYAATRRRTYTIRVDELAPE